MKTLRNIILILIALFLVIYILGKVESDAPAPTETPDDDVSVVTETELTSEKGISIFIDEPKGGVAVGSPLTVHGRAPGNWFFEANLPIVVTNWDGVIIAEGHANALGEWMTTDYVPFEGEITFTNPGSGQNGFLVIKKDNASGEPQFDDSVEMTLKFK